MDDSSLLNEIPLYIKMVSYIRVLSNKISVSNHNVGMSPFAFYLKLLFCLKSEICIQIMVLYLSRVLSQIRVLYQIRALSFIRKNISNQNSDSN